jgi:cyclic beta-1,2-glucan synthetase
VTRGAGRRPVRDHAGHRYAIAARRGAAIRRHHGAPAQPPFYDPAKRRVTAGYGILQPRVAVSLPGTNRSRYARLYGGEPGIDPYTRVASDVYQDVFGEGSFIGKGIYDVDAFEQALGGAFRRIASSVTIFSKDATPAPGLLSDVQLYEDYPIRYSADVSRRYRWIRGDWQLAGGCCGACPDARLRTAGTGPCRQANPLSQLSQWKLIDNLRRSLVPAALTLLLLLGWTLLASAWSWTLSVIGIVLLAPCLCATLLELFRKPERGAAAAAPGGSGALGDTAPHAGSSSSSPVSRTRRSTVWMRSCARTGGCWSRIGACSNGILRSMPIALPPGGPQRIRRRLAGDVGSAPAWPRQRRCIWPCRRRRCCWWPAPVLLLWFASPLFAWWISRPLARREAVLSGAQILFLRALSRRTWAFFDTFVGPEDHWLPPDNYQKYRVAAVAHRTSPTNIGMALLANLSAYDFGYLSTGQLVERTANTLRTLHTLQRHRGHFYNWYDTLTLQPLPPLYISTVDSGNLAGHLLTLRAGLLALADDRILMTRLFDGLGDTLRILTMAAEAGATAPMAAFRKELETASAAPPATLTAARSQLARLASAADAIASRIVASLADLPVTAPADETLGWAQALAGQCQAAVEELNVLVPWLALPPPPPALAAQLAQVGELAALDAVPTLRELARLDAALLPCLAALFDNQTTPSHRDWLSALQRQVAAASAHAGERLASIDRLARNPEISRAWSMTFCSTARGIC